MDESATATLTAPTLWREYVTEVREDANARAVTTPESDRRAVAVLITATLALTVANYWGERSNELGGLARWAVVNIACYVLPAVFVIRVVLKERVRDFGLRIDGMAAHRGLYLTLLSLALPVVVLASFSHGFQDKYPFLRLDAGQSLWPQMFAWWVLYWGQFVALEFFFRGFLVHGLAPRLGWISIVVMVVPYNMLHYGKPMPEALAAIVGGLVLGTLSLKTRSIWWGAALHIAIAITMDICALGHAGRLF